MAREQVEITHEFDAPVERVFDHLGEHENLGPLFGIRVERLRSGDVDRNGVGSVRRLSLRGLLPFEETITAYRPNELIEYRITKGTPLRDHLGTLNFEPLPARRTRLRWQISIDGPALVVKPVGVGLRRTIAKGLRALAL
jgi:uncharacterized membrane protein